MIFVERPRPAKRAGKNATDAKRGICAPVKACSYTQFTVGFNLAFGWLLKELVYFLSKELTTVKTCERT